MTSVVHPAEQQQQQQKPHPEDRRASLASSNSNSSSPFNDSSQGLVNLPKGGAQQQQPKSFLPDLTLTPPAKNGLPKFSGGFAQKPVDLIVEEGGKKVGPK
jgi:hypothetical protein